MEDGIRVAFLIWAAVGLSAREKEGGSLLVTTNNFLIAAVVLFLISMELYSFSKLIASGGLAESIAFYKRTMGWYSILYIPLLISPFFMHSIAQVFWIKKFRRNASLGFAVALLLNLPLFLNLIFSLSGINGFVSFFSSIPPFGIWDNDYLPAAWVYHISQWDFFPTLIGYFIILWTILLFIYFINKRRSG